LNGLSRFRQDRGGTVKCLRWADHPSAVKEDRERCHGETWGETLTEKPVWHVVREYAMKAGIDKLAPHDLRRTCVQLCYAAGGELEQIQFLLGHVSIQTTEKYLGCKQRIQGAVNDKIGIEPPG